MRKIGIQCCVKNAIFEREIEIKYKSWNSTRARLTVWFKRIKSNFHGNYLSRFKRFGKMVMNHSLWFIYLLIFILRFTLIFINDVSLFFKSSILVHFFFRWNHEWNAKKDFFHMQFTHNSRPKKFDLKKAFFFFYRIKENEFQKKLAFCARIKMNNNNGVARFNFGLFVWWIFMTSLNMINVQIYMAYMICLCVYWT